jgi:cholesterol transport system auxiliary component
VIRHTKDAPPAGARRTIPASLLVLALAPVLATPLSGCFSLLPNAQPSATYSFGLAEPATGPMETERGVALEPVTFPREAMTDGILTVQGSETAYLAGARWTAPAPVLFRQALDRAFDAAAPSAHLLNRGEAGPSAGNLSLDVSRFEAEYTQPKTPPVVHLTIRARLSGPDGLPIGAEVFDVSKPAAEDRISAIVAAYDQATVEALTGLARWVDQNAPKSGPIRAVPRSTSSTTSTKTTVTTTRQP